MSNFRSELMKDEGFRSTVYNDHLGFPTIGFGTRVSELEFTRNIAEYFLEKEIEEKEARLVKIPEFNLLSDDRKDVIRSMAYQMGVSGTMKFKMMWRAIGQLDFTEAGRQMRDSRWWRDPATRARAERMAKRMEDGIWKV